MIAVAPCGVFFVDFGVQSFDGTRRIGAVHNLVNVFLNCSDIFIAEVFQANIIAASAFGGTNQLVEFELDGFAIAVLCILNEKDHQERDDGGAGVNDKLPRVRIVKEFARKCPGDDDDNSANKDDRRPGPN